MLCVASIASATLLREFLLSTDLFFCSVVTIPVFRVDERFTSVIAEQTLIRLGKRPGKNKGEVDKLSAAIILQSFLDNPQVVKEAS